MAQSYILFGKQTRELQRKCCKSAYLNRMEYVYAFSVHILRQCPTGEKRELLLLSANSNISLPVKIIFDIIIQSQRADSVPLHYCKFPIGRFRCPILVIITPNSPLKDKFFPIITNNITELCRFYFLIYEESN